MALTLEKVREAVVAVIGPENFFVGNGLTIEWEHRGTEEIAWEVYKGRLLDGTQTRERCTFEAWNLFAVETMSRSAEPILSIKFDKQRGLIHVVRAILSYAWEPYDAGDSVILTREAQKWARELVRTISLAEMSADPDLKRELRNWLRKAVLGTSRLPLTSLESPLPAFSLGRFAYFPCEEKITVGVSPMRSWQELIQRRIPGYDKQRVTKRLEFLLRHVSWPELGKMTGEFVHRFFQIMPEAEKRRSLVALFANLFNEISLTPWTDFIDKSLQFLAILESQKHLRPEDAGDCLGQLLRHLGRHLTAYDLATFHHRGANYPDALLLDALLRSCRELLDREPSVFLSLSGEDEASAIRKRLRRRGLRQGWLLRRHYEGHLVPDAPTSPGENNRVLPPPHARVPEEQIQNPAMRSKHLYENDSPERYQGKTWLEILGQSITDLFHPDELRELGMAVFLDRPLGHGAGVLEPDGTPLFSYLAFSPSIARARLYELTSVAGLITDRATADDLLGELDQLQIRGIPVKSVADPRRQAIVSLSDALRVADDFVLLRNTSTSWSTVRQLILEADEMEKFASLREALEKPGLFLRVPACQSGQASLMIYDDQVRRRVELEFDPGKGYRSFGEFECPADPIRVIRIWEPDSATDALRDRDLRAEGIFLNRSQGRF